MSIAPRVSVIICTSSRAQDLAKTLRAINQVDIPEELPCELVIVDNASTDNTAQIAQSGLVTRMPVRCFYEPKRGKGNAYNAALAAAQGEVLLFTDDDVRPPANWIREMSAPILTGKADALAGGVAIAPHLQRPWLRSLHREWLASTEYIDRDAPQAMVGANMAFSKSVLAKVPGFDTELGPGALGFADDTLFCWQLQKAGYHIGSALDTVVEHHFDPARLSRASFLFTAAKLGRSLAYLAHHWEHEAVENVWQDILSIRVRSVFQRLKRWNVSPPDGIEEWELYQALKLHINQQYLIERKRPRNYDLHGLVKKRCP